MSRIDYVTAILEDFGTEVGLPIELGSDGRASLWFDDQLVTFAYREKPMELLWIYADLGPVPARGLAVPNLLLELNLSVWLRANMTIAIDQKGERALGYTTLPPASLDLRALKVALDMLLDVAVEIRGLLKNPDHLETPATPRVDDHDLPNDSLRI